MQDEQADRQQRRDHMQPVGAAANNRVLDREKVETGQDNSADQQQQYGRIQGQASTHGAEIRPRQGVAHVNGAKHDRGQQDHQAEQQMQEKHQLVKILLVQFAADPFDYRDAGQVQAVDSQQAEQHKYKAQQAPQAPSDDGAELPWSI